MIQQTAVEGLCGSTSTDARGEGLTPSSPVRAAAAPAAPAPVGAAGVTPNPTDRQLLAAVSRWAHARGWTQTWDGIWRNGNTTATTTIAVRVEDDVLSIARKPASSYSTTWHPLPVESVRQAVDVLCALGVLPVELSSAFYAGADSMNEWAPLPLISRSEWVREFARRESTS